MPGILKPEGAQYQVKPEQISKQERYQDSNRVNYKNQPPWQRVLPENLDDLAFEFIDHSLLMEFEFLLNVACCWLLVAGFISDLS
jgi:hypothetical protein